MSAELLGQGRSLLPYGHSKNIEAWWWKTNPPPPPPKKKKKKKKKKNFLDHYLHHNLVMLLPLWWFFRSFILLIYSSQKIPASLKFYRALHILVLHMHRKFDVDSIDSFSDMKEQSTRRKERKKERTRMLLLQATVKRFQFDLYVNLEGQQMLISSWFQK